mgnify:FL=1
MQQHKKVDISLFCLEDLNYITENISKVSIFMSKKIKEDFYLKISFLQEYPKMYQIVKTINKIKIRKIIIQKFIILYFINKKQIYVLNIYPQKSNYIDLIKI